MGEAATRETSQAGGRRIIERPRLTRLLTESESRVMLLVAPAGYGKTTLARQWLADRPHVWYTATQSSSDIAALALGLAGAANAVVAGAGDTVSARLKTVSDPASEAESLANDLARDIAGWPEDMRLVVDDYQLVSESEPADTFIKTLLAASRLPVMITSRSRPSWVTAKSLLYGEVVELGRNVLAMTHAEAAEALASSHDELPGLVTLAEGWPAVIGLAALLPYPLPENTSEVPETLHEYFAEELYDAVTPDIRHAAVRLSIAPAIDADVARAVLGTRHVETLDQCARSGFLAKVGTTFEMHPLVRQFLRTKWTQLDDEDLHATAGLIANVYVESCRWDEAAAVAAEFELVEVMLRILNDALDVVLSEGRMATIRRWLEVVRPAAPSAPIVYLASLEIEFRAGNWAAASGKARQLASAIPKDMPIASRVYLRAGQMAHIGDRPQDALDLFTAAKEHAQTSKDLRNALWSELLTVCDLERRADAEATLREIEALPAITPDDLLRSGQGRLQFANRWGALTSALDAVSGLLELVDDSNDPLVRTGFLQTYGSALGLVARYAEATPIAERLISEASRYHLGWIVPHALQMGAVAQMGRRDFDGALKSIDRSLAIADDHANLHTQVNGLVLKARVHLCRGSAERALGLLRDRSASLTSPGMEGEYLATHALALACAGRSEEARVEVKSSAEVSSQLDAAPVRDFALLIAAHSDDGSVNLTLLEAALTTVRDTGNFDAFVCAYRARPELLGGLLLLNDDKVTQFAELVGALDPSHAEKIGLAVSRRKQNRDPLTPREHEVFQLMCQGLSNREIARTLWISQSTAKVHVHHVLAKLGVRTRTEAVAIGLDADQAVATRKGS